MPRSDRHANVFRQQVGHDATWINAVFLFCMAFVFTRPFEATFGDVLTKPVDKGGLSLRTSPLPG